VKVAAVLSTRANAPMHRRWCGWPMSGAPCTCLALRSGMWCCLATRSVVLLAPPCIECARAQGFWWSAAP